MFRLFVVALVLAAFGAALYFSGDALEAWESPKPTKASRPTPVLKKKAKPRPKRHAQPAKKPTRPAKPRKAAWLVDLNALCRRGQMELEDIPRPTAPDEVATYLREARGLNKRLNGQAVELARRGGNTTSAKELRRLFDRDEAAVQRMLTLAEDGQYARLLRFARSLVPLARAENRVLARLGAVDCTVSPDEYGL